MKTVSNGLLKKQAIAHWMKRTRLTNSPPLQRRNLHAHGLQQHLAHLACFLISRFGWPQAGESPLKTVCGHVLGISKIPEFAVTETMNGQEVSVIAFRTLADQYHHFLLSQLCMPSEGISPAHTLYNKFL